MVQPHLHEHLTCVRAPGIWLSPPSGQLDGGADGLYVADRRALSRLTVTLDGIAPVPVAAGLRGPACARFLGVVPGLGGPPLGRSGGLAGDAVPADTDRTDPADTDPADAAEHDSAVLPVTQPGFEENAVTVERIRTVAPDGGEERIVVHNWGRTYVTAVLEVTAATDLATVTSVKLGGGHAEAVPDREDGADAGTDRTTWTAADGFRVELRGPLRTELRLAPGESHSTVLTVTATPPTTTGFRQAAGTAPAAWTQTPLTVRAPDRRLGELVARGIDDLRALLLADGDDVYAGAGSPWYLTLFGRDALWCARLALPLGTELAAGTLRALARRQGTRHDAETEEAPGRIPHELRAADATTWLPPVYYGSVDATPLFVVTLAEARRWGMPDSEVAALLPAAERALEWLGTFDGFVSYRGTPGKLVNQGWKDSADGIQHADGRYATPPVALCEVQGYAYQAATLGAELLDAYGRLGGDRWRAWADALADRFRARFWVDGYPAVALDGVGEPVDGVASNMGHLLGTGLLSAAEEARVADRLGELDSGWGLRTLSPRAAGFHPLSYHAGSVWPHDTAITMLGLARAGFGEPAAALASGLVAAGAHFDYRLPELFGGFPAGPAGGRKAEGTPTDDAPTSDPPAAYPGACRPQGWAAASSAALVTALLGLDPDVPAGTVRIRPLPGVADLEVDNVRVGGRPLNVRVDRNGAVTCSGQPAELTVVP